jgi:putative ABC transport system ATP-binding protein
MLDVKNLTKEFNQAGQVVKVVNDVSLEVGNGAFVSIIGKSGSGKSTLLGLLGALDGPTSGSIEVGGQDITKMPDRKLIAYRRQTIGFVFQNYNLVPNLSALENVMLPMEYNRVSASERKRRAAELLEQVGITGDKQERRPGRLSGGEQQRVSIARALANRPQFILADEPTGNLDASNGKMIFDLLHSLSRSENVTIIVVTHDLDIAGRTDKTFHIEDGKLVKRTSSPEQASH